MSILPTLSTTPSRSGRRPTARSAHLGCLGLDYPYGVAVGTARGPPCRRRGHGAIHVFGTAWSRRWSSGAQLSPGRGGGRAVANAQIADWSDNAVKESTAANGTVTTLVPAGLTHPFGVAVDGSLGTPISPTPTTRRLRKSRGRLWIRRPKPEPAAAGSDVLPVVLPATAKLERSLRPHQRRAWLHPQRHQPGRGQLQLHRQQFTDLLHSHGASSRC